MDSTLKHLKITRTAENLGVDTRAFDLSEVYARLKSDLLKQWIGPATISDREIRFGFLGVDEPGRSYFLFTAEIDRRTPDVDTSPCGSVSPGAGVPCKGGHAPHESDDGTLTWRDRAGVDVQHGPRCFNPPQGDALVMFTRAGAFMLDQVDFEQIKMWSGLNTLGLRLLLARLTDAAERVEAALLTFNHKPSLPDSGS